MSRTVTLERRYGSPPERVFEAWVDVDLLSQWFGCGPDTLWTIHRWEPHAGGAIEVSMEMDGAEFRVVGEFLVVERPHQIRYRWDGDQLVTARFDAVDDGTRVTLTHAGLPDAMPPIVTDGWTASLGQIRAVLS